jgi:hypothetical protein
MSRNPLPASTLRRDEVIRLANVARLVAESHDPMPCLCGRGLATTVHGCESCNADASERTVAELFSVPAHRLASRKGR